MSETSQDRVLNDVLDALTYEDQTPKGLCYSIPKLLEDSKPRMGEANALFIEGVFRYHWSTDAFDYFSEAEQKGCRHPELYRYLASCYASGNKGVREDASKTLEYSSLVIGGTFLLA